MSPKLGLSALQLGDTLTDAAEECFIFHLRLSISIHMYYSRLNRHRDSILPNTYFFGHITRADKMVKYWYKAGWKGDAAVGVRQRAGLTQLLGANLEALNALF